jgi:hypothetical protein
MPGRKGETLMENINTIGVLALGLLILIKDVVVPLLRRMNHKSENPVSLSVFYQEFKDFKRMQEKLNDKIDERLEKLEEKS